MAEIYYKCPECKKVLIYDVFESRNAGYELYSCYFCNKEFVMIFRRYRKKRVK